MSKQIGMTLPDIVVEAMEKKGAHFEMSAGEWLKERVLMSAHGADLPLDLGATVRTLQAPSEAEQPLLPLGGEPS